MNRKQAKKLAPKPRVLYVNEYGGNLSGANWTTKKEAKAIRVENSDNAKTVKFVEAMEDK